MNLKLFLGLIIGGSSFHFDCIVTVAELSKAEAAKHAKIVNFVEKVLVAVGAERKNRATKQVELHGELDSERAASHGQKLVRCKDIVRICLEVSNRDDFAFSDLLKLLVGVVSGLIPVLVGVFGHEDGVFKEFEILVALAVIELEEGSTQFFSVH